MPKRPSDKYEVGVLIGGRDTGKTTYMRGNKTLNINGYVAEKIKEESLVGVIVIDTQRERDTYATVTKVTGAELVQGHKKYKGGALHVIVDVDTKDEVVKWIRLNVKHCFILVEDAKNIVPKNIGYTEWEKLVIDSKNIFCPVWFMYHTWMAVPKELYGLMDAIEVFKIKQHPVVRRSDIMNYEEVLEVYERVKDHKNPYYHERVKNGD